MKVTFIRVIIVAYFVNDTLNWQVLWSNGEIFNSLYENWKIWFFKTNLNSQESVSSKDKWSLWYVFNEQPSMQWIPVFQ